MNLIRFTRNLNYPTCRLKTLKRKSAFDRTILSLLFILLIAACTTQPGATPAPNEPAASKSSSLVQATLTETVMPIGSQIPLVPSSSGSNEYSPQPGDISLSRSSVYLDSVEAVKSITDASGMSVIFQGSLPTPCHHLRITNDQFIFEVYSVVNPEAMCAQVLAPFTAEIPFTNIQPGNYQIVVNNEVMTSFAFPLQ